MEDEPDLSALASVWASALVRQGLTSRVHVALWLDEHRESPARKDVGALVRRMSGRDRLVDLAAEHGMAHSQMQDVLHRTALRLIVPHLDDIAAWDQARRTSITDTAIAELSDTLPQVVALALDGWPSASKAVVDEMRVVEAHRCWRAGGSRADVAAVLGIPADRLIRQLKSGESELLPHRLTSYDLGKRYGWTPSATGMYRRKGVLTPPDGRDGSRDWWWEPAIEAWERESELHWCGFCHHAFISPIGLRAHRTRVHN